MRSRLLDTLDHAAALRALAERGVNYDHGEVRAPEWSFDTHRRAVAREATGPPESGGAWETACALVRDYEFSVPQRIRAVYRRRAALLGRDMLLEGRFYGLRFFMGVRVTEVIDETRPNGDRVWGWSYETLEGHLERGKMTYEVVKHPETGVVEFVINGCSQASPTLGPIMRVGWLLFGRRTQLRFYARCGRRLHRLLRAASFPARGAENVRRGDLVLAPSDARPSVLERLTVRRHEPGRPRHHPPPFR
ncbi:DUF1990 family protein [Haloactinomyces albus]|uniref:Uncharacterized protein (UPF0548 family) n=1 Tax=Haloactinomyces albus TaxID=1352928 RepID=A0AAE3ZAP4_9ACTN|nr:DUF1990 family protein [Haloactinomyces albus]MDR7300248.1 uncharacterized protein (UPF0548 family) [Haloactinomyces albus]